MLDAEPTHRPSDGELVKLFSQPFETGVLPLRRRAAERSQSIFPGNGKGITKKRPSDADSEGRF